jgi:hypothetical protein
LESNYAASAAEACQIWQIVSLQDNDIARIDKEIIQVQRVLEQLQCDRDEIVTSRRAHKALISPVRRTPPEIWAQIFVLCLPDDEFVEIAALEAPLLLVEFHPFGRMGTGIFTCADTSGRDLAGKVGKPATVHPNLPFQRRYTHIEPLLGYSHPFLIQVVQSRTPFAAVIGRKDCVQQRPPRTYSDNPIVVAIYSP